MKKDWTYKKLGEVAEIEYGTRVVQKKDGGSIYPVYGGGGATFKMDTYNREDRLVVARFAMSPKCTRFVTGKFFLNDSGLTLKAGDCLLTPYLNWHVIYHNDNIYRLSKGAAQKNLDVKAFLKLPIHFPPISIQESIVRELDAIHGILEKKQEQLRELDNLAQAIFYDMFGDPITNPKQWEVKKLGEVGENGLTYGSGASAVDFDGKVRYVRITDIREDGTLNDNIMSPNSIEDKYLLNEGDLLFARSGATVGKTYLHVKNDMDYIYAGYLIRLIPNKEIVNPLYLFHITKTQYYLEFIKSTQRAVAQPNINAKQYGDFSIPLPPLSLQQSFAAKIEAIEAQKQAVQQSIREIEALLAERMDYYFS